MEKNRGADLRDELDEVKVRRKKNMKYSIITNPSVGGDRRRLTHPRLPRSGTGSPRRGSKKTNQPLALRRREFFKNPPKNILNYKKNIIILYYTNNTLMQYL
jgi:hypothetical protein